MSCEDYGTGCLHVKYLLQICGHLRCGERLFILRKYGAVAKHRDIVQVKRRDGKRRIIHNYEVLIMNYLSLHHLDRGFAAEVENISFNRFGVRPTGALAEPFHFIEVFYGSFVD